MNFIKFLCIFLWVSLSYSQIVQVKSNTQIADSLDFIGEHAKALNHRNQALLEKKHKPEFIKYLKAKWHYTTSCSYEIQGGQINHRKALEHSQKAEKICEDIGPKKHLYFQYLIKNRIYHQHGYLGQWENALAQAQESLNILMDSLPEYHLKALYILDDLGYIFTITGDPEKANEYYEKSHRFYKEYHPEEIKEIYVNFERMAENYKKLGLRHEEYKLLSEIEEYWENHNQLKDAFYYRFNTYKKLAEWYNFYGNLELSESYLSKELYLFDSVSKSHKKLEQKVLDRKDRWELHLNYARLYQSKNKSAKVKEHLLEARNLLQESSRYYSWDVKGEIDLYALEAKQNDQPIETSYNKQLSAVNLAKKNKSKHFTDPVPYQIELFKLYEQNQKSNYALSTLEDILENPEINDYLRFQLSCRKGALLSQQSKMTLAMKTFETAIHYILKEENKSTLLTLSIEQIKEFYNYETLEGLLLLGNFLLEYKEINHSTDLRKAALNIFLLSSQVFDKIYIGDKYNERLYKYYKSIEAGLVSCIEFKSDEKSINQSIQALENNASKLTWSKFMYNRHKHRMKVPDSILNKELKLKTLINYYQTVLYENKKDKLHSSDSLNLRILDWNKKLKKNREYIQKKYNRHYNLSEANFDIKEFKEGLKNNEAVFKFTFINEDLYVFKLTKNNSSLLKLSNGVAAKKIVSDYAESLSIFNSKATIPRELMNITKALTSLKQSRLTIIPSENLYVLPFETLLPNYLDTDLTINYSTSLSLYNEQKKSTSKMSTLNVGIFTGQDNYMPTQDNFLPSVTKEVENISKKCESSVFYNAKKQDFFKKAPLYNVLHFAMHSTIDSENPELSHLNFNDDELFIGELYNESIPSDLAVLSACETGNGVLMRGEGLQSVSKAFTYAGVPSTVMSLWKVDDKTTATIMSFFYDYLKKGKPKDIALKLAKKDYLNSDLDIELKHPYYWSAFIISGNTDSFNSYKHSRLWWLSLLVIPLAVFLYYKKL